MFGPHTKPNTSASHPAKLVPHIKLSRKTASNNSNIQHPTPNTKTTLPSISAPYNKAKITTLLTKPQYTIQEASVADLKAITSYTENQLSEFLSDDYISCAVVTAGNSGVTILASDMFVFKYIKNGDTPSGYMLRAMLENTVGKLMTYYEIPCPETEILNPTDQNYNQLADKLHELLQSQSTGNSPLAKKAREARRLLRSKQHPVLIMKKIEGKTLNDVMKVPGDKTRFEANETALFKKIGEIVFLDLLTNNPDRFLKARRIESNVPLDATHNLANCMIGAPSRECAFSHLIPIDNMCFINDSSPKTTFMTNHINSVIRDTNLKQVATTASRAFDRIRGPLSPQNITRIYDGLLIAQQKISNFEVPHQILKQFDTQAKTELNTEDLLRYQSTISAIEYRINLVKNKQQNNTKVGQTRR